MPQGTTLCGQMRLSGIGVFLCSILMSDFSLSKSVSTIKRFLNRTLSTIDMRWFFIQFINPKGGMHFSDKLMDHKDKYTQNSPKQQGRDSHFFFLTYAYVYALELGHPATDTLHAALAAHGRI